LRTSEQTVQWMLHVGSLTALLRSQWGPLSDESTVSLYTGQILRGLKFLVSSECGSSSVADTCCAGYN